MTLNLESGLWIDEPDALDRLARRIAEGLIDPSHGNLLRRFIEEGYVSFRLEDVDDAIRRLASSYDSLWRERDAGLAYACAGPPRRFSRADEATERRPGYRIHDPHSHLDEARTLYLHPRIHRFARDVFGEDVVAIQSLLFEYGSEQMIHRDPITVPTGRPLHLVAAWIALEDISADCGPLLYVPGSHRIPYYEFEPGQYMFDESTMGENEIRRGLAFYEESFRSHGLAPVKNTARRGEVFFWHASLFHGGAPVANRALTRKSFVVHLTSRSSYPERSITVHEDDGSGSERPVIRATTRLVEFGGRAGFENPMRGSPRS